MKYSQRVHIIPIGDDIIDRIIIPPQNGHADKVILITMKDPDVFEKIVEQAKTILIDQHIVSPERLIIRKCDFYDFTGVLELLGQLIQEEHSQKNSVFISLSTGGRLPAAAGMLACVLFGAEPYFLKMDFQTKSIPAMPEIFPVPRLHFKPPKRNLIIFLDIMIRKQQEHPHKGVSKKECLQIMTEIHPDEPLSKTSGDYNKLKYRYLDPLEELHYIQTERHPRTQIQITEEGRFGWRIFKAFYQLGEVIP